VFVRAVLAFVALPGVFAGLVPWIIASADPWRGRGSGIGAPVLAAGLVVLVWCVRDFYVSGKGTLAPWAPPRRMVVVGLYRFMRNPMYVGVLLIVSGTALLTGSPLVAFYLVALGAGFHLRVRLHEEPWLSRQFPAEWPRYRDAVPRWMPRTSPWRG
jgi:protein-S-isoprenylcysteine O-methyltransferase Ste14